MSAPSLDAPAKVPVVMVTILWSESSEHQRRHPANEPVDFKGFREASDYLRTLLHDAPREGQGYDKTGFRVQWADGNTYQGRLDLHHSSCKQETRTGECDLAQKVRDHLELYAGRYNPPGMTLATLEELRMQVGRRYLEMAAHVLDHYEIG